MDSKRLVIKDELRAFLLSILGDRKKAKRFLDAMEIEIGYEVDGYNRGAHISDGKRQDKFFDCAKKFSALKSFLETLPEALIIDLQQTADRNRANQYTGSGHLIEPLIEQLRNFTQAALTRASRLKPVPGRKSDHSRRYFLLQMTTIYYDIYDELPKHTSKTLFFEVAKQFTELAKYPNTGLEDEFKGLKDLF